MTRSLTSGIQRLAGGTWIDLDEPTPRTMHHSLDEAQRARSARLGPPRYEFAWFKRANGHRVTAPTAMPLPLGLFGLRKSSRYVLRRRRIEHGPWEDA